MRQDYQAPSIEVVEIEIDNAVLASSDYDYTEDLKPGGNL